MERSRLAPKPSKSHSRLSVYLCAAACSLQIFIQLHSFEYGTLLIRYPDFTPVTT